MLSMPRRPLRPLIYAEGGEAPAVAASKACSWMEDGFGEERSIQNLNNCWYCSCGWAGRQAHGACTYLHAGRSMPCVAAPASHEACTHAERSGKRPRATTWRHAQGRTALVRAALALPS